MWPLEPNAIWHPSRAMCLWARTASGTWSGRVVSRCFAVVRLSAIEDIVRVTNVRIAHMTEPMPFYASSWADFSLELLSRQVI